MKLSDYLQANGKSHQQLADEIGGCSLGGLRKWLRGDRIPRKAFMRKIVAATDGQVHPNDFFYLPRLETNVQDQGRV